MAEDKAEELTLDSLGDVLEEIYGACTKWYNLGLRLGLQASTLDTINMRCQKDPEECLREMLKEWLKLVSPSPSWKILIKALKSTAVGEAVLAVELKARHCQLEKIQLHRVAKSRDTERVFNEDPKTKEGDATLKDGNGGELSPDRRRNYSASCSDQQSSDDSFPAFGCRCGKCCLNSYLDKGCPEPVKSLSSFPYLQTDGLNKGDTMILKGRLFYEYQLISRSFSRFSIAICESLIDQKVPVKRLARVLRDLGAFEPSDPNSPLLRERFDEVKAASDVDDIFDIVKDYVSFFSFHVTEHIVDSLGTPDDKQLLNKYKEELHEYCKRNIFECPSYAAAKPGVADLVMKVEGIEKYNLKHLEELISHVSRAVSVSRYTLQLHSMEKGCVQLNFQVPHFVKDAVFPLKESQLEKLRELSVTLVKCGRWIYQLLEGHKCKLNAEKVISTPEVTGRRKTCTYNHGTITREVSETRLNSLSYDCFLVRESEKHEGCLTLSVKKDGKINHVLINCTDNGYVPRGESVPFKSMESLIAQVGKYLSPCPVPANKSGTFLAVTKCQSGQDSGESALSDYASGYESEDTTTDWTGTGDSAVILRNKLPAPPLPPRDEENWYTKIRLQERDKEHQYGTLGQVPGGDPQYGTLGQGDPQYGTLGRGDPQYGTLGQGDPQYGTLGRGDPQYGTLGQGEPQYGTLGQGEPQYGTLGRGEPQYGTLGRGEPQYGTLGQGEPQYGTLGQGEPQYSTLGRGEPQYGTLGRGDPQYGTLGQGEPQYGTLGQGEPQYGTLGQGEPQYSTLGGAHSSENPIEY